MSLRYRGVAGGLVALFIHNPYTSLDLFLPANLPPGHSARKARVASLG